QARTCSLEKASGRARISAQRAAEAAEAPPPGPEAAAPVRASGATPDPAAVEDGGSSPVEGVDLFCDAGRCACAGAPGRAGAIADGAPGAADGAAAGGAAVAPGAERPPVAPAPPAPPEDAPPEAPLEAPPDPPDPPDEPDCAAAGTASAAMNPAARRRARWEVMSGPFLESHGA
ncbi:MAG TPA: hypothetical protein VIL72_04355, partial [Beijerinckiaceae bacterium]